MKELGHVSCGFCEEGKNLVIKLDQLTLRNSLFLDPDKIVRLYCYYTCIFLIIKLR